MNLAINLAMKPESQPCPRGYAISGTDTDVGKTVVAAALAAGLWSQGRPILPVKAVQTGASCGPLGLEAPDLRVVLDALRFAPEPSLLRQLQPRLYEPACSPHLAAEMAGDPLSVQGLARGIEALIQTEGPVQLEGAGGLMVPLNAKELMIDLFATLRLPVVLVSRAGLGAINHVLLSAEALKTRGIPLLGVVLNAGPSDHPEDAFIVRDNPKALASHLDKIPVLRFSRLPALDPEAFSSAGRQLLANWPSILEHTCPGPMINSATSGARLPKNKPPPSRFGRSPATASG